MGKLIDKAIKWEYMNPDYPEQQMKGLLIELNRPTPHQPYIDEKVDNILRFYDETLGNFKKRMRHKDLRMEFKKFAKTGKR